MNQDKLNTIEEKYGDLKSTILDTLGDSDPASYFKIGLLINSIEDNISVIKIILDESKIKK